MNIIPLTVFLVLIVFCFTYFFIRLIKQVSISMRDMLHKWYIYDQNNTEEAESRNNELIENTNFVRASFMLTILFFSSLAFVAGIMFAVLLKAI